MALFGNFFRNRKMKKQESYADHQYLDALEIIKESMEKYLDLLAQAKQDGNDDVAERLISKLNSSFEYFNKSWDGEVKIIHTVTSTCCVDLNKPRLKLD